MVRTINYSIEEVVILALQVIHELVQKYRSTFIGYWKDFHKHPEPSHKEIRTAAKVAEILKNLGMEVKEGVGGTGVVGLLRGTQTGPTIALRADMDALQIKEETGCDFASMNEGVMHACGHDSHTAMLLGAAHVLSELKAHIRGNIKFIFQPAEEDSPVGGAPAMIKDGVLEDPKVEAIFGIHVWPTLETGVMGIKEGVMSAASDRLKMSILGKSTHAATPEFGVDAVVITSQVISALQTIISRNVSPLDSAVITFGKIEGGSRYNIVADRVDLDGTVRTFNPDTRKLVAEKISQIAKGVSSSMGGDCIVDYKWGYPPTMNDPSVTQIAKETILETLGENGLYEISMPNPGGEDFAFFSEKVPAAFAWLGCRPKGIPPENFPKLHNNKFLPDEEALPIGVTYLCQVALAALGALSK
jgi:amidohydrolase